MAQYRRYPYAPSPLATVQRGQPATQRTYTRPSGTQQAIHVTRPAWSVEVNAAALCTGFGTVVGALAVLALSRLV